MRDWLGSLVFLLGCTALYTALGLFAEGTGTDADWTHLWELQAR